MALPPLDSQMPIVVYITSRGHSGSTLLSLLIGGNSKVVSGGELKMLINSDPSRRFCSCHSLSPEQCPFWSQVQAKVIDLVGVPLCQLSLMEDGSDDMFCEHNQALFGAIAFVSGCSIIIDSSKSLLRLSRLLKAKDKGCAIEVQPIHLHRGPLGTVNSARKKGCSLLSVAQNYSTAFFKTRECLSTTPSLFISYEQLACHPRHCLKRVMRWIRLPLQESQLQWREGVRRDVGGNRMRLGESTKIRLDQSWKRDLKPVEVLKVTLLTLPVRLRWRWLYRKIHDRKIGFGL